jgi:hypothetical protein
MRRPSLLALSLVALAACRERPPDPEPRPERTFASVRVLAAVGDRPTVDVAFHATGELPVVFGALASPGVAGFLPQLVGDATAWVLEDGVVRAESKQALEERARYTLLVAGRSAASDALTTRWLQESFAAPPAGRARVRLVRACVAAPTRVELGATKLVDAPDPASVSEWIDLDPAETTLTLAGESDPLATYSAVALEADRLFTLLLVDGREDTPPRLAVVRESLDPAVPAALLAVLEPDGVVRPQARVRFLHAAGNLAALTVTANVPVAAGAGFKSLSPSVSVDTDAVVTAVDADGATVAQTTLALDEGGDYTLALLGSTAGTAAFVTWRDQRTATGSLARLGHLLGGVPGTVELVDESGMLVLPATTAGATSTYTAVPAGPFTGTLVLRIGPQVVPVATFTPLTFPDGMPVTLALVGSLNPQVPAQSTAALLVLDDAAGTLVAELPPGPVPPPP